MKKLVFLTGAIVVTLTMLAGSALAQVQSVAAANRQPATKTSAGDQSQPSRTNATRARVLGQESKTSRNAAPVETPNFQAHAEKVSKYSSEPTSVAAPVASTETAALNATANRARTVSEKTPVGGMAALSKAANTIVPATASQHYRVGIRDVLDIQLAGQSGKESTLFTIADGGLLEYPLAGGPIAAAGMTTAEVAALLRQRIKILDNPTVTVRVRDYASHSVTVTGFVAAPGVKNLRREAVPLYTLLAEALMMPEAASATISRQGRALIFVDLKDSKLAATLVLPGDVIKVSGAAVATEFFFVGGEINAPGQKPFHAGVTLTQAILAAGGTTRTAGSKVRVSRQGADGRLSTEEYNLRKIQDGKNPDPVLQKGDRINVAGDR